MRFIMLIAATALFCFASSYAQDGGTVKHVSSQLFNDQYNQLRANQIHMWISNNGVMSHNPISDASGLEWPAGSGKHVIFTEGCIVGGRVNGEVRIGGATYRAGLQAGLIRADGRASDPSDPRHRVFRVCRMNRAQFNLLTQAEQSELRGDFLQWPATSGAPWVDADKDGAYEPDFDAWLDSSDTADAPDFPGTEALWFVSNDLDPARTSYLYGTPPMGLEFQVLAWAASGTHVLDRTVFVRYTIINKGPDEITDFHIARWVDPDVGNAGDDLVGIDTTLAMMFAYNGASIDAVYGDQVPAVGIVWLQTPMVPAPGNVARFGDGWREGYRNLPVSAFAFYINSDAVYSDPDLGTVEGAAQMYYYLQGRLWDGTPYLDPFSANEVRFPLAGDPLLRNGWVDGQLHAPSDRRMLSSCGPMTLAQGDTLQVVFATVIGVGATPVQSLRDAMHMAYSLRRQNTDGVGILELTDASCELRWPHRDEYALQISVECEPQQELVGLLRDAEGREIHRIPLFDDGQHGDGASGDGRYATEYQQGARSSGCDLFVASLRANAIVAENIIGEMLPLTGEATLHDVTVLSDHLDFNQQASPGENVVLACTLENESRYTLGPWTIVLEQSSALRRSGTIARAIPPGDTHAIDGLQAGLESALSLDVPADAQPGNSLLLPVRLVSRQYCMWSDTLSLPIYMLSRPMVGGMLEHTSGPGMGTLAYTVADPSALNDHVYKVTVQGEDFGKKTLTIEDVTDARILHSGVDAQNAYGHHSPVVAGIRLRAGTSYTGLEADAGETMKVRPALGEFDHPERQWFRLRSGPLYGYQYLGSALSIFDMYPVTLVFDTVTQQKAYGYASSSLFRAPYQGFYEIPVRAYDMRVPGQPRQIEMTFFEYRDGSSNDHRWFPTTDSLDSDYLCMMDDSYKGYPAASYMVSFTSPFSPCLYTLQPTLNSSSPSFSNGDQFHITPQIPMSSRDVYMLDMRTVTGSGTVPPHPESVALYPNYPNPFTGTTNIAYRIEHPAFVELVVLDLLGRKVRAVVSEHETAGTHVRQIQLGDAPAGLYICRLTVGETVRTRRLLLMR